MIVYLLLVEKTPLGVFSSLEAAKRAAARDRAVSDEVVAKLRAKGVKWLGPPPSTPVVRNRLRWVSGPLGWFSAGFQSPQNGERMHYSIWKTCVRGGRTP